MNTSVFIARLLALVYVSVGLGILTNPKYYQKALKEILNSAVALYFGGIMALVAGFLIVSYHNYWVKDWHVVITLIGWLAVVKGASLLVFPDQYADMFQSWIKKYINQWGFMALILGIIFAYFGYFA